MTGARVEAELKYLAADERPLLLLAAAEGLGPAALGPATKVPELDRYLDTADLRLATARWACRLRLRSGRTIVSLKGPAEHAAGDLLHRRPELDGPADAGLDPRGWPPSAARDRLLEMADGAPLAERFRLAQERTERSVSVEGAAVGILSLDRVTVQRGERELGRLLVVELELASGAEAFDPRPLASALDALGGLARDPLSKFEHALAVLGGS